MKKNILHRCLAMLVMCVCISQAVCLVPVEAGSSDLIVDKTSFEEKIDTSLWNVTDSRIKAENGRLEFAEDSRKGTAIISKTVAKKTGYHEELVSVDATMDLNGIAQGKTFALALGLNSIESSLGEAGNIEIRFTNKEGVKMSVVVIKEDKSVEEVIAPQNLGSLNNVSVHATILSNGTLEFSANGTMVSKKLPVSGEGRVGFVQDGSCAVIVKDVKIVSHRYDRPENCNIEEDFEKESININELTAKMVYTTGHFVPYGMGIVSKDGNRVMEYKNMSLAYLGTMYKYSNFELTFDVIGFQREDELDEEGNVLVPKTESLAVSFGDEAADYDSWGFETSPDAVVFDIASQVYSMNLGHVAQANDKGYAFGSAECKKDFTIRVSVIDGKVTASIKWIDEENFTEILTYNVSNVTPLGYVHIWCSGTYSNFSIDNLKIINKDKDPNLTKVEFKSAVYEVPEDFTYEKITYVYRDEETQEEPTVSPYLAIPVVAVLCGVASCIVMVVRKKKQEGGKIADE